MVLINFVVLLLCIIGFLGMLFVGLFMRGLFSLGCFTVALDGGCMHAACVV